MVTQRQLPTNMTYKKISAEESTRLIDWAEENNVDWDIWNAEDVFMGGESVELGLDRWPDFPVHCKGEEDTIRPNPFWQGK